MIRRELITNLVFMWGFPLFGIIIAYVVTFLVNVPLQYTSIMLVFWVAGFLLFFKAKLSVIKRGKLISFGVSNMSKANRICYILGYVLMGLGLFFSLGLIAYYRHLQQ